MSALPRGILSPEERQYALYQGLLSAGPALMAAGAPSTTPGGNIQALQGVGQGLLGAQQGAVMQKMQGLQMEDYMRQREQEEAFRASIEQYGGLLSPEERQFLGSVPSDVGMGFLGDRLFAGQGEGFTLGAGEIRYGPNGEVIAEGPAEPFTPDIETIYRGSQAVQGYFDSNGQFVEVGSGERFAPTQPQLPSFTNFANPTTGEVVAIDLTTEPDRARQLASQGYIEVGTGVNAADFGSLNGTPVAGPVDAAGKAIAPDPGKAWVPDPTSPIGFRQEVIPGSDAAREQADAAQAAETARQQTLSSTQRIVGTIDEALALVQDAGFLSPTTGVGGQLLSNLAGSRAVALRGAIETIKANLGFDQLQAMRDASPHGGALGQVAVQELTALQATVANLDPDQGDDVLVANLNKVKQHYIAAIDAIREGEALAAGDASIPEGVDPELWDYLTPEQRALWQN